MRLPAIRIEVGDDYYSAYQGDKLLKQYLRVSRMLDWIPTPELVDWKLSMGKAAANRELKRAEKVGTAVDKAISRYLKDGEWKEPVGSPETLSCAKAAKEWLGLNPIEPELVQETLLDSSLEIGGTIDCYDKQYVLRDWKCTKAIRPKHVYQICTYWLMMRHLNYRVDRAEIVRFDPFLAIHETLPIPELDPAMSYFLTNLSRAVLGWVALTKQATLSQEVA